MKSFLDREGNGEGQWLIDKNKDENRKSRGLKFGKSTRAKITQQELQEQRGMGGQVLWFLNNKVQGGHGIG